MKGSIRKRGSTWYYSFDIGIIDGKRKRKEKGGFRTKSECEKALRTALNEFDECGSVFQASEITFNEYLDYWYKEYVLINCKHNTINYYKTIIDIHLKTYFKNIKLKQLNPALLQKFLNYKMINGYSKNSVINFYGVLSGSLKYAVYPCNYIRENPLSYVRIPKYNEKNKESTDLKIISYEDFNRIIKRFPAGSNFYIPLQIAFHTGMRGGEVTALTWDNVDLENKTISVKHTLISKGKGIFELGTPKTKSSYRKIDIGDTLVSILKKHKLSQKENKLEYGTHYKNSNFICTKENGELITTDSLKYLSRIINYDLEISFNFHSLRHTHATMLIENGANIKTVQRRLGHSKLSTTMDTYAHVTDKMKTEAVNILENIIADN
jgi:integrase